MLPFTAFHPQARFVDNGTACCCSHHHKCSGQNDFKKKDHFLSPRHGKIESKDAYDNIKEQTDNCRGIHGFHPNPVALLF